jgi:hypothetical protein
MDVAAHFTPWAADEERAKVYRDNPPGNPVGSPSGHQIDAQYWPEPGETCTRPECAEKEAGG